MRWRKFQKLKTELKNGAWKSGKVEDCPFFVPNLFL